MHLNIGQAKSGSAPLLEQSQSAGSDGNGFYHAND